MATTALAVIGELEVDVLGDLEVPSTTTSAVVEGLEVVILGDLERPSQKPTAFRCLLSLRGRSGGGVVVQTESKMSVSLATAKINATGILDCLITGTIDISTSSCPGTSRSTVEW